MLPKIDAMLLDAILPNLKSVQANQAELTMQAGRLNRNLEQFRAETQILMAEVRAEMAQCRQELEDTMVTLRESEAAEDSDTPPVRKKRIVN
jgi:hypothetical protein